MPMQRRDTAANHMEVAQAVALECGWQWEDDSPLFPTRKGKSRKTPSKSNVVAAVTTVAELLGEETVREGANPLRVSGARWLGALGVEVAKISLLARWSSDVVLRYVAEAPLPALTDECKFRKGSLVLS
eukprot:3267312-Amphidinium_carterae.5